MAFPPIPKPSPNGLKIRPNLDDYDAICRSASLADTAAEIGARPGGSLNIGSECLDRHLGGEHARRSALIWQGRSGRLERYTFEDLKRDADRISGALASIGVRKGDRVFLFLERIPELYIAILAALRAGAVVGPLFSSFGPDALRYRLQDSGAKVLLTSPSLLPRLRPVRDQVPDLQRILVAGRDGIDVTTLGRDEISLDAETAKAQGCFDPVQTSPEDYAFIHYTCEIGGRPLGAAHVHDAVRALRASARYVLDLHDDDVYWCTADPGWIAGTAYGVFAPWSCGVTCVVDQGGFSPEAWYRTIERHRVTVWYTTSTAIRTLMKAGAAPAKGFDLSSLRHICSVGERLNPEAIGWAVKIFGTPVHETWWQTETGSIQIANYPVMEVRPGSAGRPVPGVTAAVVDQEGRELPPDEEGDLTLKAGSPSMFRTYWSDPVAREARFRGGWYQSGVRARRDPDGYFWIVERPDDVIDSAGHIVGPFEVESTLLEHPAVAEAGVIGKPDAERTEILKAFVVLKAGIEPSESLKDEIRDFVGRRLALHAYPREIEFTASLPRTRGGRILRRLLKAREIGRGEAGAAGE